MIGPYQAKRVGSEASLKQLELCVFVCSQSESECISNTFQDFFWGTFLLRNFEKYFFHIRNHRSRCIKSLLCLKASCKQDILTHLIFTYNQASFQAGCIPSTEIRHAFASQFDPIHRHFNNTKYMPSLVVRSCVPAYMEVRPLGSHVHVHHNMAHITLAINEFLKAADILSLMNTLRQ